MSLSRKGRKLLIAFVFVFLCSAVGFAFPHDPNPSTIDDGYFPGSWMNTLRSFSSNRNSAVNAMRVMLYLDKEFMDAAGPGAPNDLKIWNTPAFTDEKVDADRKAQAWLIANPTRTVPLEEGSSLFTTHDEMVEFLEKLPRTNLTVEYLGEIPRGFPFPFLVFSTSSDRTPEGLAATGKPLVWVQGNIHGGEWSGAESTLAMAQDLATGRYDDLLAKINVIIVPRVCADGAKRPNRASNDLVALQWTPSPEARDLNRDNMLLDLQVTRAMRKMNMAYGPHFCIDLHERGASNINSTINNTFGMLIDNDAHDIGSSGTTILQVPKELIALRYDYMEKDLQDFGKQYGVHFGFYREGTDTYNHGILNNYGAGMPYAGADYRNSMVNSTAWDPDAPYFVISEASYNTRSSRNINAMPGVISQLFENKSGPTNVGNRGMFERRVATGYICILSTLTTAANRADELLPQIMDIRKSFVEKGKKVSDDDMIPILTVQPRPRYVTEREWTVIDIDRNYTGAYDTANAFSPQAPVADLTNIYRYDGTKALQRVADGTGFNGSNYVPVRGTGSRDHQFFKIEETWKGTNVRERVRPYAYIFEGPYADELATRMMLAGIDVKRLAEDVTIDVEGWYYNARTIGSGGIGPYVDLANSGSSGWLNRDVTIYPISGRTFKKDAYVVYLGQLMSNLIPMYMEPDLPWSVSSCIFLPYMSVALGGAASGALSPDLVGVEMPAYRYLEEVDLPTYDVDHFLPLVNKGAVARFFSYHTQEQIEEIADDLGVDVERIKVYDYDFQVHARTDSLVGGKFNISLPTSSATSTYKILTRKGKYEDLVPNSEMFGWNVGTIDVADHGVAPFTVDLGPDNRPVVGDGSNRTLPRELPAHDDLIGVRIVEIMAEPYSGSSGGCNATGNSAGFMMFAFLAVVPLFALRSRKRS